MRFHDRLDAGRKLAAVLSKFSERQDVALFALPRGGVVLGGVIAEALGLPLDVIVTRKIGAPDDEEYALGALSETGEVVWGERRDVPEIIEKEKKEAERRVKKFRDGRPLADLHGKTALIVDDGVATGLTIRAAIAAAKHQGATKIVLAVPHGAKDSLAALRQEADEVIALFEPESYGSVGAFYVDFRQVEDAEVVAILKMHAK